MRITMIGHSTVLIEGGGARLLTDPYFGTFGNPAFARVAPPAMAPSEIGRLDGVLASHAHWDHTDRRLFRGLDVTVPVAVPSGARAVFRLKGARTPVPMRPWQALRMGDAVVTAVPAAHVARTIGYVVEADGSCVYFAGDTYYRPFMAEIGRRFHVHTALLPVTTYRIPMTMGPRGAVRATRDLGATVVIPIHLGLKPRSPLLRTPHTPDDFRRRLREAGIRAEVVVLGEGESWDAAVPLARAAS